MSVTFDLSPKTEDRLKAKAASYGMTLEAYMECLAEREAWASNGLVAPRTDSAGPIGTNPRTPATTLRPLNPIERRKSFDFHWAMSAPEVQQHEGKFVVVHNKRVIAVGADRNLLLAEASAKLQCPENELVVVFVYRFDLQEIPH